jgi:hypothetical protein
MGSPLKAALEDLLRARRLQADAPPLRGEDRRLEPLPTGVGAIDALLGGGIPRGQLSEVHGAVSSGKTGLALCFVARLTGRGALAAWVDPFDCLDPASAAASGVLLSRLLWLRGDGRAGALPKALSATGTLAGAGLFDAVVLDFAGAPASELRRIPGATWIRLQRIIEAAPVALVLLAEAHTACSPGGVSLALLPGRPRWSGSPGPGRLLRALAGEARAGRHALRAAPFELYAFGG